MIERFLVASEGTDSQGVEVALSTALRLSEKHGCDLTVLVPALKFAKNTSLADVLPKAMVERLASGKAINFKNILITMKSPRNFESIFEKGIILVIYATHNAIKTAEKATSCKAIVVQPWQRELLSKWETKTRPMIISI